MASVDDDELGSDRAEELEEAAAELEADLHPDADDAEEDEEDDEDGEDGEGGDAGRGKGLALGPTLMMFAAGGWLIWAVLHFGVSGEPGPSLAVVEEEPGMSAPADAEPDPDPAEPEPAIAEAETDTPKAEPEVDPDLAPDETPWVEANWTEGIEPPKIVNYVVKRGGKLVHVANLFKIYHHEILELNPGLKLEQELAPGTEVVVYRAKPEANSESIGQPSRGSLEGAVPMLDGPGRELKMVPWKGWATGETVATLDRVLREWRRRFPDAQPVLVGNMSSPTGGRLEPHASHQSGRDVDLSYPQIWDRKEELNWREMSDANLDRKMTWELLQLLVETGAVEHVFIDSKLQKLLYEYAKEHEPVPKRRLSRWLEYPRRPGSTGAIVQHVPGHIDHMHVRFACAPDDSRCVSK